MWLTPTAATRSSLCVAHTDSSGSKEPCRGRGQDWTNTFAATRVDKSAMWPFAKLLWILVYKTTPSAYLPLMLVGD